MTSKILGIDPSLTATGFCLLKNNRLFLQQVYRPKNTGTDRLFEIEKKIEEVIASTAPDIVVIEGYAYARTKQAHQMGELGWAARRTMENLKNMYHYEWFEVSPNSLKKFATGKGNSKKDTIMLYIYKRWKVEIVDNNIADAYILAKIGQAYLGKEKEKLTNFQKEVLEGLLKKAG